MKKVDFENGSITGNILQTAFPMLVAQVLHLLYSIVDRIYIGRIPGTGTDALGAVGLCFPIIILITGFTNMFGMGGAPLFSIQLGKKKKEEARQVLCTAFRLLIMVSFAITVTGELFGGPLLKLFGAGEEELATSLSYLRIYLTGTVPLMLSTGMNPYITAMGFAVIGMLSVTVGAVANLLLDPVFIFVFGMGVEGAAFATVLSQGLSAVLCLLFILTRVHVLVPARRHWGIHREATIHQMRMGVPMALQFSVTAAGTIVMQAAINMFGSIAVAAFTAAWRIQNILTQGMIAMGMTMAAFCGQNFGNKDFPRIRKGVRTAVQIEIIYSLAAGIGSVALLPVFMRLFFSSGTDLGALMPWAMTYTIECAVFFIPLSMIFIFRNAMQGCSYSFLPLMGGVVEMAARVLCAIAGIFFHSYLLSAGCDGAAWLTAGLFTLSAYRYMMRRLESDRSSSS